MNQKLTPRIANDETKTQPQPAGGPKMDTQFPPEAEGCEPRSVGSRTMGVVPGVNEASAKLVEDFRVTRYELEVLARHYLEKVKQYEHEWTAYRCTGSTGRRMLAFGERRLDSIERILGKDVLDKVLEPVEEKWRKTFDDLRVFLATPGKCEQCGEEFDREVAYQVTCEGCPCTPF